MATSGQVNTNTIYTGTTYWYIETNWSVSSWSGNTATISWSAYLRRQSGSKTQVTSYGISGSVGSGSWSKSSGTNLTKDQLLGSGTFTLSGGSSVSASATGHIYGSSSSYAVSASQSWTLDNNVTTPTVTCSLTQGLNTLGASLTVTNTGGATIQSQSIKLYSDNACTNLVGTINGTSGTFTGLTPNTTYYAKAQANNGTYTGYSSVVSKATYNKATISTAPNIDHGNTLTVTYANPSSSSLKIALYTSGGTVLCADRTCTGTSYTFTFTDTELDKIYKEYGNSSSFSPYVILRTANTYYDTKTITITLKGNQKTIRDKVSGSWKRGKVYVKVSGTWKQGVVWTKVSGTWKRGI